MNLDRHLREEKARQDDLQRAQRPAFTSWKEKRRQESNFAQLVAVEGKDEVERMIPKATFEDACSVTKTSRANAVGILFRRELGDRLPAEWLTLKNLQHQDKEGNCALHYASQFGWGRIPKELLTVPNLSISNKAGYSPLQKSLYWGYWQKLDFFKTEEGWLKLPSQHREMALKEIFRSKIQPLIPVDLQFIKKDWKHLEQSGSWAEL